MSEQAPVRIPREVLKELESVRHYTRTDVLYIPTIRHVAMERHKPALVVWIDKHEQEYGQGLLNGFWVERKLSYMGPQVPKDVARETARDLSALVARS